jgi:hypothetical protein
MVGGKGRRLTITFHEMQDTALTVISEASGVRRNELDHRLPLKKNGISNAGVEAIDAYGAVYAHLLNILILSRRST